MDGWTTTVQPRIVVSSMIYLSVFVSEIRTVFEYFITTIFLFSGVGQTCLFLLCFFLLFCCFSFLLLSWNTIIILVVGWTNDARLITTIFSFVFALEFGTAFGYSAIAMLFSHPGVGLTYPCLLPLTFSDGSTH